MKVLTFYRFCIVFIMTCTEAEYAYNKRKRIVAIRLEADYMPDGWLGLLCYNNLYYDFSDPEKFDDEWSKLYTRMKELKRHQGCDSNSTKNSV